MLRQRFIHEDSPAGLRRLLLVAYGISVPTFAGLLALEAPPPHRVAALGGMLATAAAGAAWLYLRRAPASLDWTEAHFRILESHLNDIELVITPDGAIVAANDRAVSAFGYPRRELLSMNVEALVPPERRATLRAGLLEAQRVGVVAELEHVRRDGTQFAVEISSRPFEAGGATYIHGLLRDLEPRRAAEQEHRFLAALVGRMAEGVITFDSEGLIRTWSAGAERLYGWSAQEVVGRSPLSFFIPESGADQFREGLEAARVDGEVHYEVRRRTKSGGEFIGSVAMVGLRDERGREDGVLAVVRDVTPQKTAEAALCESQRRLSSALEEVREEVSRREKLLSVVAHDLRSPLSAVALMADGLEHLPEADVRPALAERGEIIRDAAHQMRRLVDDLVDVAAIQRENLRLTWATRDPRGLLEDALRQLRPVATRRGVALQLAELPPDLPQIRCDRGRILQVLTNLLSNALNFTPAGGSVTAALAVEPAVIRFTIRDTGPGLSPDVADRLFEPYRRGPDAEQKGAGLGLAIAKGIVDAHGGRIWAERAQGSGAVFHFTLRRGDGEEGGCRA